MGQISAEDLKTIAMMERAHVLQNVDGHKLPTSNGAIFFFCGDGDQSLDFLPRSFRAIFTEGDKARPHLHADNGGALLLPRESPLYNAAVAQHYLDSIRGSRALKGIDTLVLEAHAPCGMAAKHSLNFEEVIRLLKLAKVRVLEEVPGLIVACFVHIDRNGLGLGKEILFLHGASWRAWNGLTPEERERRYGAPAPSEAAEVY